MGNNSKENVIHMFFGEEETKDQVMENKSTACDKCGEEKVTTNGRCDDCFEKYGDSLEEKEVESSATVPTAAEPVMQNDGQFSLFDFGAVVEESKKEETTKPSSCDEDKPSKKATSAKESKKTAPQPKSSPTSSVKKQDIEVEGDFTIHYATQHFLVSDFFEEMPESGKVTLEELRSAMAQEFFEMTKQRVKWDYDLEQKRLYPDVIGTSKGGF
ncbi:hypothetical protein [Ammoniphilus resinae]|uniref:Uncharacterized protein n=1 Tax=Ammoniphilus resinae TaxID=861532 RepID=A0ABS4GNA5_9BACL|nr:hypothetical protein [Ammoniphilus resinae]MBP1931755.1 hypothetical protein [Ammoniphilus resinae]